MSKTTRMIFLTGLCLSVGTLSAQVLAEWPLDKLHNGTAVNVAAGISAGNFTRGNGIGSVTYSPEGADARAWTGATERYSDDYFEICLSPEAGQTMEVTGLHFRERRVGNGPLAFELLWSTDGFEHAQRIDSLGLPNDQGSRSYQYHDLSLVSCGGVPLCFRWYGFAAESSSGKWQFESNSLIVNGSVLPACSGPLSPGVLGFSGISTQSMTLHFSGGSGDRRLVLARAGSPVTSSPCQGQTYQANTVFGEGSVVGPKTYVVYDGNGTSATVTGLTEGEYYYFSVFEYVGGSYCYRQDDPATGYRQTLCQHPGLITSAMVSPGNGTAGLFWTNPPCFDEVLVVGSTHPISGLPTGDGSDYNADPVFGNGTDAGTGFSADEFPVWKNTGNAATVTGLTNEQTYYFRLFLRKGTLWSAGPELQVTPTNGCPELGGNDVVFFNEIHYVNMGPDQDEGIEIAGPAGVDLSAYRLYIYEGISNNTAEMTRMVPLSGIIDDEGAGAGALWFPIPDMPDGAAALALYNYVRQIVVQFIAYRVTYTAVDGPAAGMTAPSIKESNLRWATESPTLPAGFSIQLTGEGKCPSDFTWRSTVPETMGRLNKGQTVLPIELLDFTARAIGQRVLIRWQTANEINNDYMIVEKSSDGLSFGKVGTVKGAGTTNEAKDYALWDDHPLTGISYYRLRQVDFDGKTTLFPVVAVEFKPQKEEFGLFPNPTSGLLQIAFPAEVPQQARLEVLNAQGQLVWQKTTLDGNGSIQQIDIRTFPPGMYWLRVVSPQGIIFSGSISKTQG